MKFDAYAAAKIVDAASLLIDEQKKGAALAKAWDTKLFVVTEEDVPEHIWEQIKILKDELHRFPGTKHFSSAEVSASKMGPARLNFHRHSILAWAIELGGP